MPSARSPRRNWNTRRMRCLPRVGCIDDDSRSVAADTATRSRLDSATYASAAAIFFACRSFSPSPKPIDVDVSTIT